MTNTILESDDIQIDYEMDVDCDIGQEITCYVETWFDVDKKFKVNTAECEDVWLNMYTKYNPFEDSLRVECEIDREDESLHFDYEPTREEAQLLKDKITQKILEVYEMTPSEFCNEFINETQTIGGLQ